MFNFNSWSDSFSGGYFNLSGTEKLKLAAWWAIVSLILWITLGPTVTSLVVALWIVSRGTAYHVIRLCAEFLEHTGLEAKNTITFTRNLPHSTILAIMLHPHEDTYHLIHHIFMGIPHFRLKKAHLVLSKSPVYRAAHHCDSYLLGNHPALSCWLGNCDGGGK